MEKKLYQKLAISFAAYQNCINSNNSEWANNWQEKIDNMIELLPSGSGIDGNTYFDYDNSTENKLVINSSYHVMNDVGYYTHWIDYKIIIKANLCFGYDIDIKGQFGKDQDIKDYLIQIYQESLNQIV